MAIIPTNKIASPVYSCTDLLSTVENDLYQAESYVEFRALQQRQDALLSLLNSGVEFTTITQLNVIAKTDT